MHVGTNSFVAMVSILYMVALNASILLAHFDPGLPHILYNMYYWTSMTELSLFSYLHGLIKIKRSVVSLLESKCSLLRNGLFYRDDNSCISEAITFTCLQPTVYMPIIITCVVEIIAERVISVQTALTRDKYLY